MGMIRPLTPDEVAAKQFAREHQYSLTGDLGRAGAAISTAEHLVNPLVNAAGRVGSAIAGERDTANRQAMAQNLLNQYNAKQGAQQAPIVQGAQADLAGGKAAMDQARGTIESEWLGGAAADGQRPGGVANSPLQAATQRMAQQPMTRPVMETLPAQQGVSGPGNGHPAGGADFPAQQVQTGTQFTPGAFDASRVNASALAAPQSMDRPQQPMVEPPPQAMDPRGNDQQSTRELPQTGSMPQQPAKTAADFMPASNRHTMESLRTRALHAYNTRDEAAADALMRDFEHSGADAAPETWQDLLTGGHRKRAQQELVTILKQPKPGGAPVDEEMRQAKLRSLNSMSTNREADDAVAKQREADKARGIGGKANTDEAKGNVAPQRENAVADKATAGARLQSERAAVAPQLAAAELLGKSSDAGKKRTQAGGEQRRLDDQHGNVGARTRLTNAKGTTELTGKTFKGGQDERRTAAGESKARSYDWQVHHPMERESSGDRNDQTEIVKMRERKRDLNAKIQVAAEEQSRTVPSLGEAMKKYGSYAEAVKSIPDADRKKVEAAFQQNGLQKASDDIDAEAKTLGFDLGKAASARGSFKSKTTQKGDTGDDLNKD